MVDGIDELLDPRIRLKALRAISFHRDSPTYKFLITSRPLTVDELHIIASPDLPVYFIEPFSEYMLPTLANNWFRALRPNQAANLFEAFTRQLANYNLLQLTRIPLIATMTCIVFVGESETLPVSRIDLYEKFIKCLFEKRWSDTGIHERLRLRVPPHVSTATDAIDSLVNSLLPTLRAIACQRQEGSRATIMALASIEFDKLKPAQVDQAFWESLIREVLRQCGLLVERNGAFSFIHQSIEEYLAARQFSASISSSGRRRADILLGIGRGQHLGENLRLFLASIWLETENELSASLNRIIKKDTPEAASFIASLVLDGGILPENLLDPALELLTKHLGMGSLNSSGFLSGEAILLIEDALRIHNTIQLAFDKTVARSKRLIDIGTLSNLTSPADIRRVRELAAQGDSRELRIVAARVLATSGLPDGIEILKNIISDPGWSSAHRLMAVSELRTVNRELSQQILVGLARDPAFPVHARIDAAATIVRDDREIAHGLMVELSYAVTESVEHRQLLAEYLIRSWKDPRGQAIYIDLIRDQRLRPYDRFESALILLRYAPDIGKKEMLTLATDPTMETSLRVYILKYLSSADAKVVYKSIVFDRRASDVYRMEALRAMTPLAPQQAIEAIRVLAQDESLAAETRNTLAQLPLPGKAGG